MRKAKLMNYKQPGLTDDMCKLADIAQKQTGTKERKSYDILMSIEVEEEILKAAIFFTIQVCAGVRTPAYIIFFNKKEDRFLTYDFRLDKWRTCLVENLEDVYCSFDVYISPKDEQTIQSYFDSEKAGYSALQHFQEEVRYRKRLIRVEKITGAWDEKMKQVPKLPRDWEKWVITCGITEQYIFYQYKKEGAAEGYCTRCQKMVPIKKPKYNARGLCSKCRKKIQYKSVGRFKRIMSKTETVQIIQPCPSGIILRKFGAQVIYDQENVQKPRVHCKGETRIFYDREWNPERYYFGWYKMMGNRWIAGRKPLGYYYHYRTDVTYGRTYEKNLINLEQKELKYTGLVQALRKMEINPDYYLSCYKKLPILEKILKVDLNRLADDIISNIWCTQNISNSSLTQALEINKEQLKRLRKLKGGIIVLNWLQYEKENGKRISDEVIEWFDGFRIFPEDLSFILDRMSPVQIMNYLLRQAERYEESIGQTLTTWNDYLSMAIRCGHDVRDEIVYRTSKLFDRHQDMVDQLAQKKRLERVKEVLEKYPNVQQILLEIKEKYAYQDSNYAVVVPESIEDICWEGKSLHHCVASSNSYFARMQSKETYILFLRETENMSTPYYTLEVEPDGTVRQKQTYYGRDRTDIQLVEKFLAKWQNEVRMRIGREEVKLAAASKQARERELKSLREEHIVIRGGIYDGRQAADVLGEDLMESTEAA